MSERKVESRTETMGPSGGNDGYSFSWVSSKPREWITGPEEAVYIAKRRGPCTKPWGTPVDRDGVRMYPSHDTWRE